MRTAKRVILSFSEESPDSGDSAPSSRLGMPLVLALLLIVQPAAAAQRSVQALTDFLARADGATDHSEIARAIDELRAMKTKAAPAAETLSSLLPHRAKLYRDRDRVEVVRLRSHILVTLSEIGFPQSAEWALFDILAHLDETITAREVGAAARCVRALDAHRGREFAPKLLEALSLQRGEEELSLDRYDLTFPPEEATTIQLEAVRSLAFAATTADDNVLRVLRQLSGASETDRRVVREARQALGAIIRGAAGSQPADGVRPWTPIAERARLGNLDIAFTDHEGRGGVLRRVVDKPVVITFFYTRCQNARKCSMAVNRLGALQRQLARTGIEEDVRLLAITYEPQFDTPERIHRYATDRGLRLGENALALRLDESCQQRLVDEIQAPANYNTGWINTHGVELSLLDRNGGIVRKYHTVLWDNDQVVRDLQRILAEK